MKRWMDHLEGRGELIRINRPVDVVYEAGAIADLLTVPLPPFPWS